MAVAQSKKNGVYNQVKEALSNKEVLEFSGVEPNPEYETCMKAVEIVKKEKVDFLLAVGGGSVIDATKFIAAAVKFEGEPWDILEKRPVLKDAMSFGTVLTLPATGSEMNQNSVVSRREKGLKKAFMDKAVFPKFSILDPEVTYSLPTKQTVNGIVDAMVHVIEQYITYDVNSPLIDRQAEAILSTLIEEAPKVLLNPKDYDARANIMWCATQALNHNLQSGTVGDWSVHAIGHELTAKFGIDHGQSLAIVLPSMWKHEFEGKKQKLAQYANRVWKLEGTQEELAQKAISKTVEFFNQIGMKTKLSDYGIKFEDCVSVGDVFASVKIGERQNISKKEVLEILQMSE
jgi:NADP-dependent alcohol dehydrogenase